MLVGSISGVRRPKLTLRLGDSSGVVLIPAFDPANTSASATLSENNARVTTTAIDRASRSLQGKAPLAGAFYFEMVGVIVNGGTLVGVVNGLGSLDDYLGSTDRTLGLNSANGDVLSGGGLGASGTGAYVAGDVIGVFLNRNLGKIWFSKNGVLASGQDPVGNTGGFPTPGSGDLYAAASVSNGGSTRFRTLVSQFSYPLLSGYTAWGA